MIEGRRGAELREVRRMGGSLHQILEGFYISGGPSDMYFPLGTAIVGRDSQAL